MNQPKSVLGNSLLLPNGTIIKNRIFKSAMSEALGTAHQNPSQSLVTLYKTWAVGGAGLVVTGNVMIDRNALGEPNNVAVEDERDLKMLMKWAQAGTENGTHLWMQLNHPGKQSPKMISKEPVAPSAVPLTGGLKRFFNQPRALQVSEIEDLINRFGEAARIAKKAGFTGVQIHAAHGYLFNQFLSPYHNQRTDEWGGALANRMRFLEETYKEIRKQVGKSFPIGIKLNSADFQKGGFTEDESMEVLQKMSELGIDLIEISGGNYENPIMMGTDVKETTKKREAYFIDYAKKAQELITTPLVVTGGFRSQKGMEEAIANEETDMVGIARPFALVPDLANRIFNGSYETIHAKPIRTGIKRIDKSASLLEIGWYEQQLARMGKSKSPNPDHNVWISLLQNLLGNGRSVFFRRRA
ncbi:NADH:flavin oxidoreductase/NADH oxidase family protein [Sporosarcina limicola]|uniref:2,4-dienoyl-CoA reductase-like NADH-dependent reductase (Old Yellow Enzyme family) n=1 Tax=Sporosarcina limicola TaxID=34101 RepID=A0A927R511_9BACL|nr:NADH:flavin oxidoreductase/NADH oxidase family protein [Sporosarcina limicola]MBE1555483.1 2,4-dienoyl-CoA reductase-like NADH-dependent reductase (Old Yellow Enzyme family) [Sporosarcina limicola]